MDDSQQHPLTCSAQCYRVWPAMVLKALVMNMFLEMTLANLDSHRTTRDLYEFDSSLEDPDLNRTVVELDQLDLQEITASKFNLTFMGPELDPSKPNITIGFLTSFLELGKTIAGAVPLAIDIINKDPELLPNHNLYFNVVESGPANTPTSIRTMTELRESGVTAFIGPELSCEHEAMVAAAWNMPMISYKCSDVKVSNKDIYSTFARTRPPSSKVAKSLISLLKHFQWNHLILLVTNHPTYLQVSDALKEQAVKHSINIFRTFYLPGDYMRTHNSTLSTIIQETYRITRVYVLLAEFYALVDFVGFMQEKGLFDNGEYIVILFEEEEIYNPKKEYQYIRREFDALEILNPDPVPFRSVLLLGPCPPINPDYEYFQQMVFNYTNAHFDLPVTSSIKVRVPIYAGYLYDAVMIYASALTQALANNMSEMDGLAVFQYIKLRQYESILGFSVMIDEKGDAEGNYTVMTLVEVENGSRIQPVARFNHVATGDLPELRIEKKINWVAGSPPLSEPLCGFTGEKCEYKPDMKMVVIYTVCCFVTVIAGSFICRHYRYEHKLACLLWKVDMKDVIIPEVENDGDFQGFNNTIDAINMDKRNSGSISEDLMNDRTKCKVGFYKRNAVYIYHVYKKSIDLTRSLRKEMIQIREMRHENINPFIGACVDPPNICILTLFCARGSLQDVLKNSDLHLDTMFIASLVADLVRGMIYIHESEIVSHGNLKSSNCIVDSRWMLKITDLGLHEFRDGQDPPPDVLETRTRSESPFAMKPDAAAAPSAVLWRAPELLRMLNPPPRGTQKGDVYSFGIILFEIMGRIGPWGKPQPSVKYVQERIMNPQQFGGQLFRPPSHELDCPDYIKQCMEHSWAEDPDVRPDFKFIKLKLRVLHSGLHTNIFDNMISIMEKYAYNLETVVKERTHQLLEEKKKTENLLLRMIPKPVAEQLLRGEQVEAESFDSVTIYFSDVVGFTSLSAVSTPLQVVDLLNDLYTCFDSIIGSYDVYKVETIGDAYMVVSGLPIRNELKHAGEIASLALRLLEAIDTFEIRHRPSERLSLRIGINSGPCVAGVVGLKMPRYCLFGDTVNTASRMESTGEAMKIHVSEACKKILDKLGGYILQERGLVHIKGKGEMRTFWLTGKEDYHAEPFTRKFPSVRFKATTQGMRSPLPDLLNSGGDFSVIFSPPSHLNTSYRSLFKDIDNLENDARRETGYRSAPTISFREFFSPSDYTL